MTGENEYSVLFVPQSDPGTAYVGQISATSGFSILQSFPLPASRQWAFIVPDGDSEIGEYAYLVALDFVVAIDVSMWQVTSSAKITVGLSYPPTTVTGARFSGTKECLFVARGTSIGSPGQVRLLFIARSRERRSGNHQHCPVIRSSRSVCPPTAM
jgi:hypothetical protein